MGLFNKKNSQEAKTPEIKKQPAGSAAVNPDDKEKQRRYGFYKGVQA